MLKENAYFRGDQTENPHCREEEQREGEVEAEDEAVKAEAGGGGEEGGEPEEQRGGGGGGRGRGVEGGGWRRWRRRWESLGAAIT